MLIYCEEKLLEECKFKNLTINFYDCEPGQKKKLIKGKTVSKDPFTFFLSTLFIGVLFLQKDEGEIFKFLKHYFDIFQTYCNGKTQNWIQKDLVDGKLFFQILMFIPVYLSVLFANYNCEGFINYLYTSLDITLVYFIVGFFVLLGFNNGQEKHFNVFFYSAQRQKNNYFIEKTNWFAIKSGPTLELLTAFLVFIVSSMLLIFLNVYKLNSIIKIIFVIIIIYMILMSDIKDVMQKII